MTDCRVVISGIGVASPAGVQIKDFTEALFEGRSSIGSFDTFDSSQYRVQLGATVDMNKLKSQLLPSERRLPRPIQFAVHSTRQALNQSGVLENIDPRRIGCYLAGPACAVFETEQFYRDYLQKGITATNLEDLAYSNWDSVVNEIGRRFHLMGPRNTVLTACSSSGVAIGLAFDLIRLGLVDAMIVGGTDGFSELTYSGFHSLQNISDRPCAPFDRDRSGLSFGEGAGVMVIENFEHAKKRGAPILGEIAGYGAIGEGYNLTAPHPDAYGYKKTMNRALYLAKVNEDEVQHVNAHGTATLINDRVEGEAIRSIFHSSDLVVNSIKSIIGHCMGASGALEAINTVLSVQHQVIPGTVNFCEPDPEIPVFVTSETRDQNLSYALCNSSGFGGNNSSLLFKRVAS